MKVPALYRKRRGRGGAYYGSYLAKVAGVEVALNTKNATIAFERLGEALRGKREWPSDAELTAQALEGGAAGAAAAVTPAPDAPPVAAAPPAPPPIVPDHIEPPRQLPPLPPSSPAADAQAEAEATNAAAAETGGAGDAGDEAAPGIADMFTPEALDGLLQMLGSAVVEGQLLLQAWIIERKTGRKPLPVPEPADPRLSLRTAGAQAWVVQFKRWFPEMSDTPPWMVAVGAPFLMGIHQITNLEPEKKQADPPAAQAAA